MEKQSEMATLSKVLNKLREKGFENELVMKPDGTMFCEKLGKVYQPEDLLILRLSGSRENQTPEIIPLFLW